MSIVDYELIEKSKEKSNGHINNDIIKYASNLIIQRFNEYISNITICEKIRNKLNDIKINLVTEEELKKIYIHSNGTGISPAAFCYENIIYFRNDYEFKNGDFHNLIHEMLHIISTNGDKHGLYQILRERKQFYGYGFNEACTEFLTSLILDEPFSGYTIDLSYLMEIFLLITKSNIEDLITFYIQKDEWLNDDVISKFNSKNNELVGLVIEFDQRLSQTRKRKFNPDDVLILIINSIKNKITDGINLDYSKIQKVLKELYNYYSDLYGLNNDTKQYMSELLDFVGPKTINCKN